MLKLLSYLVASVLISTEIAKEVESVIGLHLDNELKKSKIAKTKETLHRGFLPLHPLLYQHWIHKMKYFLLVSVVVYGILKLIELKLKREGKKLDERLAEVSRSKQNNSVSSSQKDRNC